MSRISRGKRNANWLLGCGLVALVPLLFVAVVGARTCGPLQSALEARAELLERHGQPGEYSPPPAGIPPERFELFLEVRRALAGTCTRFGSIQGSMDGIDELGDRADATGKEIARAMGGLGEIAGSITPLVGEFFEQRNQALLQADMGFGEYGFLYLLSYQEALRAGSAPRGIFAASGNIRPEVGQAIGSVLRRSIAGLDEDDPLRPALEREARLLEADPTNVPFRDGLPDLFAQSLAPYRSRLDEVYCPFLAEIELDLNAGPALIDAIY